MSLMIWGPMFEVGVHTIDSQHRKLFDLANQLAEAIIQGKGTDLMEKTLADLVTYIQTHFAAEEQLMANNHYPATAEHKAKHQALIQKVLEHKRSFDGGDPAIADKTLQFFTEWLSDHIMHIDKALAHDLKQKGIH
jgi:hemerythrin-like metal-binding protein